MSEQGWQPIETAPKDEIIVVQLEDGWVGRAVWEDGEEEFLAFDDDAQRFGSPPIAWIRPADSERT